ncbi:MAG TPA: GNAT family N-acetyltransferase [Solirubrobacteraceae bacterium]|nr:GNAT family N-acetyltransferase [Solirubrobacteraceae bacterium]
MEFEVAVGGVADIDGLKPLWLEMLSHHRALVGSEFPIRMPEPSWEHSRQDYLNWLTSDAAILVIARDRVSSESLGYAICRLLSGSATFDLGAVRGDVDSLVVHDSARGRGIGTALLEAVRASLVHRGVSYWSIGVLAHNPRAAELYERVGFRPWTQELLASTTA